MRDCRRREASVEYPKLWMLCEDLRLTLLFSQNRVTQLGSLLVHCNHYTQWTLCELTLKEQRFRVCCVHCMLGCPLLLFKANTQCTVEHMSLAFHVISLRSERARAVSQPTHAHCPSLPGHIRSTPLIIHYDSRSTIIMSHLQIDACGHEHRGLKDAARYQHVVRQVRAVFGALFAPRIPARASCYQCRPWPLVSLAQIDGWPSGRASRQSVGDDQTPLCRVGPQLLQCLQCARASSKFECHYDFVLPQGPQQWEEKCAACLHAMVPESVRSSAALRRIHVLEPQRHACQG